MNSKIVKTVILAGSIFFHGSVMGAMLFGDPEKGASTHDAKCAGCHVTQFGDDGSSVYIREDRIVNSIEGLMGQVARCNQMTKTGLDGGQLDDVISYLNESHYEFGE